MDWVYLFRISQLKQDKEEGGEQEEEEEEEDEGEPAVKRPVPGDDFHLL
jgi:hypothetical protein